MDNFEKEEEVDINALLNDMKQTDQEMQRVQAELVSLMKELTSSDNDIMESLNSYIKMIEG